MEEEKSKVIESLLFPVSFVAVLWLIKFFELYTHISLAHLGILPRATQGLVGIITAPLVHVSIGHLGSNTIPLLILGIIIFYFYRKVAFKLIGIIYFFSGICVWLFASGNAYHLGASGLVYGLVSFLFFSGLFRNDKRSLALALLVTFVYGSLIWGVFPIYKGVSWETHLFASIAGIICAWYFRKLVPIENSDGEEFINEDEIILQEEKSVVQKKESLSYVYNKKTGTFEKLHLQSAAPTNFKYVYVKKIKMEKLSEKKDEAS